MRRRDCLLSLSTAWAATAQEFPRRVPAYEAPLFDLPKKLSSPVKIASIEYLAQGKATFVRATSTDGVSGIVRTKDIDDFVPILLRRVIPAFVGKDARDLESLIDAVYIPNYKIAGQPFWSPVAAVEHAVWDLLGRTAKKPVYELMHGLKRKSIPVYLSGSGRETTAEEEVDVYVRGLAETNTRAVKFKISGRMSRNLDAYPGRTKKMLELARKRMGDGVTIYVDANGSYDAPSAIETGKWLAGLGVKFFEEPCPWEEVSETKKVADALSIDVAGGEQESSLWKVQDMIERRVVDIVQPDMNYCGGLIRASRIARMAAAVGMKIVPHNTQTDAAACKLLHFAATTANIGSLMEFPHRGIPKPESWYTPNFHVRDGHVTVPAGPGLGVDFDPAYLAKLRKVEL